MFQGVHWHWQNRAKFSFNIWGSIAQALNWRLCERKWKLLCQLLFQWQLSPFHFILLCKDPFCLLLLLSLCVYIQPTQLMRFGGFLIAVVKKGVKYLYTLWICTSVYWLGADGGVSFFRKMTTQVSFCFDERMVDASIYKWSCHYAHHGLVFKCTFCVSVNWKQNFRNILYLLALSCQHSFVNCISLAIVLFWCNHQTWDQYDQYPCTGNLVKGYRFKV